MLFEAIIALRSSFALAFTIRIQDPATEALTGRDLSR
jgi:hypothetical protein